jgi:hypothetical protein
MIGRCSDIAPWREVMGRTQRGGEAENAEEHRARTGGAGVSEDLLVSVKDQIVRILAHGATLVTSVEVFARGFPEKGSKSLWVRLRRAGGKS